MKTTTFVAAGCAAAVLALAALAQAPAQRPATGRFEVIDVYVDSSEPLAAWQFELGDRSGGMQVVGIEGGESPVFAAAPYYDRDAVDLGVADRVIVASFSLDAPAVLPVGRTRVASVHVRFSGATQPDYDLRLVAAGATNGDAIPAEISFDTRTGR